MESDLKERERFIKNRIEQIKTSINNRMKNYSTSSIHIEENQMDEYCKLTGNKNPFDEALDEIFPDNKEEVVVIKSKDSNQPPTTLPLEYYTHQKFMMLASILGLRF